MDKDSFKNYVQDILKVEDSGVVIEAAPGYCSLNIDGQDILEVEIEETSYCCGIKEFGGFTYNFKGVTKYFFDKDIQDLKDNFIELAVAEVTKKFPNQLLMTTLVEEEKEQSLEFRKSFYKQGFRRKFTFVNSNSDNKLITFFKVNKQ